MKRPRGRRRLAVSILWVALVAACADADDPPASAPVVVAEPDVEEAAAGARARLVVRQVLRGGVYTEGGFTYYRLRSDSTGERVMEGQAGRDLTRRLLRQDLEPGSYRLLVWHRACEGSCQALGARVDRCARTIDVVAGQVHTATVVLRPGDGCRIIGDSNTP